MLISNVGVQESVPPEDVDNFGPEPEEEDDEHVFVSSSVSEAYNFNSIMSNVFYRLDGFQHSLESSLKIMTMMKRLPFE